MINCIISYTFFFFFFNDTATTEIYTLSLHDALPIWPQSPRGQRSSCSQNVRRVRSAKGNLPLPKPPGRAPDVSSSRRSEEHTSELQSRLHLVCRLLLEKKNRLVMCLIISKVSQCLAP